MNRYRVTQNEFGRFVAEWRPWWFPFWSNCYSRDFGDAVTCETLEEAKTLCKRHENPVVWEKPAEEKS